MNFFEAGENENGGLRGSSFSDDFKTRPRILFFQFNSIQFILSITVPDQIGTLRNHVLKVSFSKSLRVKRVFSPAVGIGLARLGIFLKNFEK